MGLLNQNMARNRADETGVGDRVLQRSMRDRRVILFDHVDNWQPGG